MDERNSRIHLMEHARMNGYEKPLLEIFRKVDEALLHAKSQEERDIIALQGIMEIDSYYKGGATNLNGMTLQGSTNEAIRKVLGEVKKESK